ncbi:BolA family protein [Buchnera aphidicola]|uniref:BolA family protein n=1 Tax=Buchnera aphidicola TaxID=9 RepID=UPI00094CAA62|nr:BolA/IbaG family iron-sulfur metabolism protein [Buchnera aphidicola]
MKKIIKNKLKAILNIQYLKIINNSQLHRFHQHKPPHYTIIIVSDSFNDLSRFQQHKKIFSVFLNDIPQKIYSMKLHTYNTREWKKKENQIFLLTPCIHQKK